MITPILVMPILISITHLPRRMQNRAPRKYKIVPVFKIGNEIEDQK